MEAVRWDVVELGNSGGASEYVDVAGPVLDALSLALLQIRHCALSAADDSGFDARYLRLILALPLTLPSEIDLKFAGPLCWPLNFDHLEAYGPSLVLEGEEYAEAVKASSERQQTVAKQYSARAVDALLSRRSRAASFAIGGMRKEQELLGEDYDADYLKAREFAYILLYESLGVASKWGVGCSADALAASGGAFRAAYWLWLEDDDRSMALARTALEQIARARTWRLKPVRAKNLEGRGSRTSARDWLEAAGWRRLSAFNRSLGEFAHISAESKWSGARSVLVDLQAGSDLNDRVTPDATARGSALNRLGALMCSEVLATLQEVAPGSADGFVDLFPDFSDSGSDRANEDWLTHVWQFRSRSFGNSDFSPPS